MGPLPSVGSLCRLNFGLTKLLNSLITLRNCNLSSSTWFLPQSVNYVSPIQELLPRDALYHRYYSTTGAKRKKEYAGRKLVGFTMDQMYSVVQDVENYKNFVPFCRKSDVKLREEERLVGELEIGFHPVVESYISHVTLQKPRLVKADCIEGKLFDHLTTTWQFSPGLKDHPQSCVINFYVSFEFKTLLHSQMAHFFFNELVRQMEGAFFDEAKRRYGPPSIEMVKLNIKS